MCLFMAAPVQRRVAESLAENAAFTNPFGIHPAFPAPGSDNFLFPELDIQ
jgi:hypothetical protein